MYLRSGYPKEKKIHTTTQLMTIIGSLIFSKPNKFFEGWMNFKTAPVPLASRSPQL